MVVSERPADIEKLRRHIESLEDRLDQHNRVLRGAIEQRDTFILESAWGLLKGGVAVFVFVVTFKAVTSWIEQVFGWHGTIALGVELLLAFAAALLVLSLVTRYLDRQRSLAQLPEWEKSDLND